MMKKRIKYELIKGVRECVVEIVQAYLDEGWELYGYPFFASSGYGTIVQAVIKYDNSCLKPPEKPSIHEIKEINGG